MLQLPVSGDNRPCVKLCCNTVHFLMKVGNARAERITRGEVDRLFGEAVARAVAEYPCTWVEIDDDPRAEAAADPAKEHWNAYSEIYAWDEPNIPRPHRFTISCRSMMEDAILITRYERANCRVTERPGFIQIDAPPWYRIPLMSYLMDRRFTYRETFNRSLPVLRPITAKVRKIDADFKPLAEFAPDRWPRLVTN